MDQLSNPLCDTIDLVRKYQRLQLQHEDKDGVLQEVSIAYHSSRRFPSTNKGDAVGTLEKVKVDAGRME